MLYETRRILLGFRLKLTFDESLNKDMSCIFVDVSKTATVGLLMNNIIERFHIPHNSFLTVQNCQVLPTESIYVLLDVNSVKITSPPDPSVVVQTIRSSAVPQEEDTSQETNEPLSCDQGDVVDGKSKAFAKPRPPKRPIREGIAATIKMLLEEEEMDKIGKVCSELHLSNDISKIQSTSRQETMNQDDSTAETSLYSEEISDFTSDACSDLNIEKRKRKRKRKHAKNHVLEDQPLSSSSFTEPAPNPSNTHRKHIRFADMDGECPGTSIHQQNQEDDPIMSQQSTNQQMHQQSPQAFVHQQLRELIHQRQLLPMDNHGQQSLEQKQYQSLQQQEEMPIIRPGPMNPQIVQPVGNSTMSLAPVDESNTRLIWQGTLKWEYRSNHSKKEAHCRVTLDPKDIKLDLKAEHWPPTMSMELIPKQILSSISEDFLTKNASTVFFNILPSDTAKSLALVMKTGCTGFIKFLNTPALEGHLELFMLTYSANEKRFIGYIPTDQKGTISRLCSSCPQFSKLYRQNGTTISSPTGVQSSLKQETLDQSSIMETDEVSNTEIHSGFSDRSTQKLTMNQVEVSASTGNAISAKSKKMYNQEESYHRPKSSLSPYNGSNSLTDSDNMNSSFINLPRLSPSENKDYKPKHDRVEKELATLLMCKQLNTSMEYNVQFVNDTGNSRTSSPSSSKAVKNGVISQLAVSPSNRVSKKSNPSNLICQNVKIERNYENDIPEQMNASSDDCEFLKQVKLDGTRIRLRKPDGTWTVLTPEIADVELPKLEVPKENQSIVFRIVYLNQNFIPTSSELLYGQIVSYRPNTNKLALDIPYQFVESIMKDCEDEILPETIVPITGSTFEVDLSTLIEPKVIS